MVRTMIVQKIIWIFSIFIDNIDTVSNTIRYHTDLIWNGNRV